MRWALPSTCGTDPSSSESWARCRISDWASETAIWSALRTSTLVRSASPARDRVRRSWTICPTRLAPPRASSRAWRTSARSSGRWSSREST